LPLHYDDAIKLAKTKINTLKGVQYSLDTVNLENVKIIQISNTNNTKKCI